MIDAEAPDNDPIFDQSYAEIERLRDEKNAAWDSAEYNAKRARKAESTISRLREYAGHKEDCMARWPQSKDPTCDCGYDALLAALATPPEERSKP